ncbi:unnamed protein product [Echinostoma caproni]|uniref:RING-type E3 ubiquitin transferase n=1 Tax=Echinostoma caproni TaxID=27848 RepID=A0A183APU0_9TREM|nr:unnamed protein product [Echinostoma caproni]
MHLKVIVLITMAGPSWWLRRRLEAMQNELIQYRHNVRCPRIFSQAAPLLIGVGLSLAIPYLIAHYAWSYIYYYPEFLLRYVYPFMFFIILGICSWVWLIKELQKLYTWIKDEKYLVGRRLVNCGPPGPSNDTSQALTPSPNQSA